MVNVIVQIATGSVFANRVQVKITGYLVAIKLEIFEPANIGAKSTAAHIRVAKAGLNSIFLRITKVYDLRERFAIDLFKIGFHLACLGYNDLLKYTGSLIDKGNREGDGGSGK